MSLTDLVLSVQEIARHDISMEIGTTSESVTVAAETENVNTTDATVSTVIDRATVAKMPLNGRSFQGLITLSPGVSTVAASANNAGQFVVNGQRSDANYFTVDGVSANASTPIGGNTLINGTGASPSTAASGRFNNMVSVDALEEFRISTSSFAPELAAHPAAKSLWYPAAVRTPSTAMFSNTCATQCLMPTTGS